MRKPLLALAALACAAPLFSCVSGTKIRADSDVIKNDIERAKQQNAKKCAPRELALAEANLDFAHGELLEGNSVRAQDHIAIAEENVKKALVLSRDCGPKKVVIQEPPKPPADRDGDGVLDPDDKCPDVPGPKENAGCPLSKDTDGDGIPDDLDRCPTQPEDKDGFQDEDGCPEPDNDGDGIVDAKDKCPNNPGPLETSGCPDADGDKVADWEDACVDVAGVRTADPKTNGCPGDRDGDGVPDNVDKCPDEPGPKENNGCPVKVYKLVVVKKDKIEIKQQVHFATNKSKVLPDSYELLNQVAQVLKDFPDIKKLSVDGHTDNVGTHAHNMTLSQARADSVRQYLVDKGIDGSRLEAHGFGPDKPIASNKTAKGKAENRRTEFNILEREGQTPPSGGTP
jgi:outer membrane protein OmpA-like peptidoglycan-associated protein